MTLQGMIIQSALDHNFQLLEQQLVLKCPTLEKNFGRCCYPKTIDGYGKKTRQIWALMFELIVLPYAYQIAINHTLSIMRLLPFSSGAIVSRKL